MVIREKNQSRMACISGIIYATKVFLKGNFNKYTINNCKYSDEDQNFRQ